MSTNDRARPWWRRLVAALAPTPPDGPERLARHYSGEVRLADALIRDAEPLARYPQARVRILEAAERARGRAERIRLALEESGHPVTEPATRDGLRSPTAWDGLRASVSEVSVMSERYLADAYVMERGHPVIAGVLHDLHRESARDRRDLIWTLAQLTRTAVVTTTSFEEVADVDGVTRRVRKPRCRLTEGRDDSKPLGWSDLAADDRRIKPGA